MEIMSLKDIQINRKEIRVFSSFEESDASDRNYWHSKSPAERLEALELDEAKCLWMRK